MSKPLGLGIAGAGIAALQVLPHLSGLEQAHHAGRARATCGRTTWLTSASAMASACRCTRTVEAMCRDPRVDAIWIASPNALHAEHTICAARHGKHVICEKPMAVSLDQCAQMVEAVERHGVKYVQGHSKAYDTPIRKMAEILATGELGRVIHIQTWNWNDWLLRALVASEVDTEQGSGRGVPPGPAPDRHRALPRRRARAQRACRRGALGPGLPEWRGQLHGLPGVRGRRRRHHGVRRLRLLRRGRDDLGHRRVGLPDEESRVADAARAPRPDQRSEQVRDGAPGQLLRLQRRRRRGHQLAPAQSVLRPDGRELASAA